MFREIRTADRWRPIGIRFLVAAVAATCCITSSRIVAQPPPVLLVGEQENAAGAPDATGNSPAEGSAKNPSVSPDASGSEKSDNKDLKKDEPKEEYFNIFGQGTVISQWHGPFTSPYSGPHSFQSINELKTSETATLDLGARPFENTEVYFDPEIAGGEGDSSVFGIGAFPNGDITRVGKVQPTPYVARLYVSQAINFGGETEQIKSGPNQLAGTKDIDRLTISVGKMAATDWIDANTYSHDPRSQFMNWALMYNAAWDYPADVRGYTDGSVIDFNQKDWAFRYGIFAEPTVANGADLDLDFGRARGQVWEVEQRYKLWTDQPGKLRFMVYWNRADMGNYREATDDRVFNLDITETRRLSNKYGFGLNLEQAFTTDLGGFFRWGWDDGHTETWAFTECDRTVSFGLSLKGTWWCRAEDVVGCGLAIDGLSSAHAAYLAAGGLGFELGDGKLDYASEIALETYYDYKFKDKQIWITPDLQFVADPGYNEDRGPVVIGAVRVHVEF
jgi:high affinity Mn2+ porin